MRHGRQETTWWSRNWGWVVGAGCGCLLLPVVLVGACVGGVGWLVSQQLDTDTVFADATAAVQADPEVRELLGAPIEVDMLSGASTHVNIDADGGDAEYTRTIRGPGGSGTMHVEARRSGGEWTVVTLLVTVGDESVDVLANAGGSIHGAGVGADGGPDATGAPESPSP